MHKYTKFDDKNSWVNLEKSISSDHVGNKKQAIDNSKLLAETAIDADREINCMTALGELYYKTDD